MNKFALLLIGIIVGLISTSQVLRPVTDQSSVKFKIKNFGFNNVTGSFTGLQGTIKFNPENLSSSSIDVTVQAKSVNTGIDRRDNHLRKEEYFDVQKYPTIRFVSGKITSSKSDTYLMSGKLTIKNVTREISFPFTAVPQKDGYLFNGEFKINRINFGVGGNSTVGDNLTVMLNVFARK